MWNVLKDAKSGNQSAFSQIASQYSPLIRSMSARYASYGAEPEDLEQEALIALYSAVLSYEEDREVTFGLYAKVCIRNRMISYLRRHGGAPRAGTEETKDPEKTDASDPEGYPDREEDPEQKVIDREQYEKLMRVVDETLSDLEKKVLRLYLRDGSYSQIAKQLRVSEKTVDNAIYRMKAKLRRRI